MFLVDTDIIVDWLKGREPAIRLLAELDAARTYMSIITLGEVYEGIFFGADEARFDDLFQRFLAGIQPLLFLDETIVRMFARLRGALRAQGNAVPDFDLLIAATALHYDLTVVTRNIRHFGRVPGLRLYEHP